MGLHYNIPSNIKDYENPQREYEEDVAVLEKEDEVYKIILWNDDVNTFDDVIDALVEICEHTLEQAEQAAEDEASASASTSASTSAGASAKASAGSAPPYPSW